MKRFVKNRMYRACFRFLLFMIVSFNANSGLSQTAPQFGNYPSIPKLSPGDTLYIINPSAMNAGETLLISTLAGIVAQKKAQIYIRLSGSYEKWLNDLEQQFGLVIDFRYQNDPWGLLSHFKNQLAEPAYLLCDFDQSSMNVATSLSGIWRVVAVDAGSEDQARANGLYLKLSVRGKDEAWCFQNYWQEFYSGLLIQQKESLLSLRDYGPLARAFTFFDGNSDFMLQVMDAARDNSPILGWGDASQGEDQFVRPASQTSVFTIAADHAWNLSLFSAVMADSLYQRTHRDQMLQTADSVHTVTFVMSDGDNLQWLMNDFSTNEKWYGSPLRGRFNMGWTISPSMVALAPSIMDRLYRDAANNSGKDYFVCGVSGGGYLYPSYFPNLADHCDRLDTLLTAADLNIVTILERRRGYFTPEILDKYTRQPHVMGCLYLDYAQYDYYGGKIVWSNGKPVVSARFNLWQSFDTPESIAATVNQLSRDPANSAAYSFINVHPWSKSLQDVQRTINLFAAHVQVVTPEEFMQRIVTQVPHVPSAVRQNSERNSDYKLRVKIFPNPMQSSHTGDHTPVKIYVENLTGESIIRVQIVNLLGRVVYEQPIFATSDRKHLELIWRGNDQYGADVGPGMYFIRIFMKRSVETRKLMIL